MASRSHVPRPLFLPRALIVPEEKPLKRRVIIKRSPLVSLVDLPSIVLFDIISRLSLDDIFINFFYVCKFIRNLILDLLVEYPDYFTRCYRENYLGIYFVLARTSGSGFGSLGNYFGRLMRAEKQVPIFSCNKIKYVICTTRTILNRRCQVKKIDLTPCGVGSRCIIVSCNGILCLRLTDERIFVTNPMFLRDDDYDVVLPEPIDEETNLNHSVVVTELGCGMGFGNTRSNSNKFKVLIAKNYAYTPEHCIRTTCQILTLGIDQNWRVLPKEVCWFCCGHLEIFVTFDGTIFWIGHCSGEAGEVCLPISRVCVAFDIEEEKARAIELPPEFKDIDRYFGGLVILGKNLCLYDTSNQSCIFIWKMMMGTTIEHNIWNMEFLINKCDLIPRSPKLAKTSLFAPIAKMSNGEIMMYCWKHRASCLYNPVTKKIAYYVITTDIHGFTDQAIPYTPNFVPLKDVIKRGIDKNT